MKYNTWTSGNRTAWNFRGGVRMGRIDVGLKCIQLRSLVEKREYQEAYEVAEKINLDKVNSIVDLKVIASVYERLGKYEQAKDVLLRSYEKKPTKMAIYRLAYLCVKTKEFEDAEFFYQEFSNRAPNSPDRYILRYGIDRAKGVDYLLRIATLQKLKQINYMEEWGYELAKVYHKAGLYEECVQECNDLITWFGDGIIVEKAQMLRQFHEEGKESLDPYGVFDEGLSKEELEARREQFVADTQDLRGQAKILAEQQKQQEVYKQLDRDLEKTVDLRQVLEEEGEDMDLLKQAVHRVWGQPASNEYETINVKKVYGNQENNQYSYDRSSYEMQGNMHEFVPVQTPEEVIAASLAEVLTEEETGNHGQNNWNEYVPEEPMTKTAFETTQEYKMEFGQQEHLADENGQLLYSEEIPQDISNEMLEEMPEEISQEALEKNVVEDVVVSEEPLEEPAADEIIDEFASESLEEDMEEEEVEEVSEEKIEETVLEDNLQENSKDSLSEGTEETLQEKTFKEEANNSETEKTQETYSTETAEDEEDCDIELFEDEEEIPAYVHRKANEKKDNKKSAKKKQQIEQKESNNVAKEKKKRKGFLFNLRKKKEEEASPAIDVETIGKELDHLIEQVNQREEAEREEFNTLPPEALQERETVKKKVYTEDISDMDPQTMVGIGDSVGEPYIAKSRNEDAVEEKEIMGDIAEKAGEHAETSETSEIQNDVAEDATAETEQQKLEEKVIEETLQEEVSQDGFMYISGVDLWNYFSAYQNDKRLCDDIQMTLEGIKSGRRNMHMLITCKDQERASQMGRDMAKAMKSLGFVKKQQVARVTAEKLNRMHLEKNYEKLEGGFVLVEGAKKMTADTAQSIMNMINEMENQIVVILTDARPYMDDLMNEYKMMRRYFANDLKMK